jgi:hypothetical protein
MKVLSRSGEMLRLRDFFYPLPYIRHCEGVLPEAMSCFYEISHSEGRFATLLPEEL